MASPSPSWSHFTTNGRSVGRSVSQSVLGSSPFWNSWPHFYLLSDQMTLIVMGRPLWRQDGSVYYQLPYLCQLSLCRKLKLFTIRTVCNVYHIQNMCKASCQSRLWKADYIVSFLPSHLNAISLIATTFKPLTLPVHGFVLPHHKWYRKMSWVILQLTISLSVRLGPKPLCDSRKDFSYS
jgi:hypothetical protein